MRIEELTELVVDFRERRDWAQYHHPKELASALSIEVSEIMELFRFKTAEEVKEMVKEPEFRDKVGAELADSLFSFYFWLMKAELISPVHFARSLTSWSNDTRKTRPGGGTTSGRSIKTLEGFSVEENNSMP